MVKLLTQNDINPALKEVPNPLTKNLIVAGITGDKLFPSKLRNYVWMYAKPYDMALIIIAYYTYCMRSNNSEIKKFGKEATVKNSRSYKLFNYILESNGSKIKSHLSDQYFTVCMIRILEKHFANDVKITAADIIKEMAKKAKDIDLKNMEPNQKSSIQTLINKMRTGEFAPISQKENLKRDMDTIKENFTTDKNEAAKKAANEAATNILKNKAEPYKKLFLDKYNNFYNSILDEPASLYEAATFIKQGKVDPNTITIDLFGRQIPILAREYISMKTALDSKNKKLHYDFISELINAGADPNTKAFGSKRDSNYTILLDSLCSLVDHTVEKKPPVFDDDKPLIQMYINLITLLIKKGANVNVKTNDKETPILLATKLRSADLVHLLIEKGADVNIPNKYGETPVHMAAKFPSTLSLTLISLLKKNPELNVQELRYGRTPLHIAAANPFREPVARLLKSGANPNIKDNDGCTPLHLAASEGNTHIIDELLKYHADPNILNKNGQNYQELLPEKPKSVLFEEILH